MLLRTLTLGSLLSTAALAETSLPPVLVSAARAPGLSMDIPAATTIIDRQEIEDSGARDVAELLRRVTGVHVSRGIGDGGQARIDMRGFGSAAQSNIAVMINGRKINPPTDSATLYLNSIDLDTVAQIEIIEGSSGTLYGNQAVGGLINIITVRPESRGRQARVAVGSYKAWELMAGLTERFGDDIGVSLLADKRESDNYRDRSATRMQRLDARLEIEHGGGYSYLDGQLLQDYVETPGALLAGELSDDRRQAVFPGDYLDTDSKVLRIGTSQALDPNWRLEAELALRDDHREFVQSFRGFPGTLSTQDRRSFELTPRMIGSFDGTVYTLGIDVQSTDYSLLTAFGPQDDDQDIAAWYGQVNRPLSAKLSVTAGVRHARVYNDINDGGQALELDDSLTVGSLGFSYRPDDPWRLFLRADQNYRFPKVDEQTNVVFGQPAGLKTQRGTSYEAGAEYAAGELGLNARAYSLQLENEISFDASTFSNINIPHSKRNGIAFSVDREIAGVLLLGGGYEYLDSEITSGPQAGSQVPLAPQNKANLFAEYRPLPNWLVRLDVEYIGQQYLGGDYDNNSEPLDAYTVADLVAHHDLGDWRLTAKVNNLFDARYSETGATSFAGDGFNPAPERNFWIGISYRLED
ncbi:MAG: TonB-dependent receptor [Sedimenticolaceae bacterium]